MNKKAFYIIIPLIFFTIGFYFLSTAHSNNKNNNTNTHLSLSPIHLENNTFNNIVNNDIPNNENNKIALTTGLSYVEKCKKKTEEITVLFSPRDDIRNTIIQYIQNEKIGIICAAFRLTDTAITKSLQNALDKKIKITFIIDREGLSSMHSKLLYFVGKNAPIYFYPPLGNIDNPTISGLMHNKIMLFISQKIIITGSFNYTKSAQDRNKENIVIIKNNDYVFNKYLEELQLLMKESTLLQGHQVSNLQTKNKKKFKK